MTTRISRLQLVVIPSTDQDRSIAFYESLGFEKRADAPFAGDLRWVEMYPPDGKAGIAVVPAPPRRSIRASSSTRPRSTRRTPT